MLSAGPLVMGRASASRRSCKSASITDQKGLMVDIPMHAALRAPSCRAIGRTLMLSRGRGGGGGGTGVLSFCDKPAAFSTIRSCRASPPLVCLLAVFFLSLRYVTTHSMAEVSHGPHGTERSHLILLARHFRHARQRLRVSIACQSVLSSTAVGEPATQ